ncbi:hypothetical protein JXB12_00320, partial [candidate division KSB1 bacterium]|nr:hypothetical protein [candidate division KSB1 bacterium]
MRNRFFIFFFVMILMNLFASDHVSGQWHISPDESLYEYNRGESFSIEIRLSGSDGTISALGMDFHYPETIIQYDGHTFSGTLLEAWMFKDISQLSAGTIRIAGFTSSGAIDAGTTGTLVVLNFTVLNDASAEGDLTLTGFTDNIAGATTSAAIIRVASSPADVWDVSPSDSLYEYSPGSSFMVDIKLQGDGDDIGSLGFDLSFPNSLLDYDSTNFEGTLLDLWQFRDANLLADDTLRIAGFTTTGQITAPAEGILVSIHFTVKPGADGEGQFTLDGFTDGLAGSTTSPATFRTKAGPGGEWDVSPSNMLYE